MTTRVSIYVPADNNHDVLVEQFSGGRRTVSEKFESTSEPRTFDFYIYSNTTMRVSEVPK